MPAIKVKTDWTIPGGGKPAFSKHIPLPTAETGTELQVHWRNNATPKQGHMVSALDLWSAVQSVSMFQPWTPL